MDSKKTSTFALAKKVRLVLQRKFGWVAETSSLLNCRTGNRTGGSNPPASAPFCKWRFRLAARTHASHAWNTGSIPVGATNTRPGVDKHKGDFQWRRFRLAARTHASHAWNTGSIPVGATNQKPEYLYFGFWFVVCLVSFRFCLFLPFSYGECLRIGDVGILDS